MGGAHERHRIDRQSCRAIIYIFRGWTWSIAPQPHGWQDAGTKRPATSVQKVKHSGKACVCETSGLGKPNLDTAWLASTFLVCNLTTGWPVRWNLIHVSQCPFPKPCYLELGDCEERESSSRPFAANNPYGSFGRTMRPLRVLHQNTHYLIIG